MSACASIIYTLPPETDAWGGGGGGRGGGENLGGGSSQKLQDEAPPVTEPLLLRDATHR